MPNMREMSRIMLKPLEDVAFEIWQIGCIDFTVWYFEQWIHFSDPSGMVMKTSIEVYFSTLYAKK